mgnify:CR=1 FL=1
MVQAKNGDTVAIEYVAKTDNKIIFDSKTQIEPLEITIGRNDIIPAFENSLIGMQEGDSKVLEVDSNNAFGPYLEELITRIDRSELPKDLHLEVGMQLQVQPPQSDPLLVEVLEFNDNFVLLDANHPLAGKDLTFEIKLLKVK